MEHSDIEKITAEELTRRNFPWGDAGIAAVLPGLSRR